MGRHPGIESRFLLNGQGTALLTLTDPGAAPPSSQQGFASRLARVADLNGDGKPELLVAKPGETTGGQAASGVVFLVTSNRPPIADAGPNRTVVASASCQAQVVLDASGSSDPDGDALTYKWSGPFGTANGVGPTVILPLGKSTITLVVDDGNGGSDLASVDITVADMTPPRIASLAATPATLWPPNHTMRRISFAIVATDNCDAAVACRVASVSSNEPENGLGDGDTAPDSEVIGDFVTMLRAERSGAGIGRIYSVEMVCRDLTGNASTAQTTVTVPKGN